MTDTATRSGAGVTTDSDVVLRVTGARKSFGFVSALSGVDLTLHRGEVLALLGDNGAGKSTLIKALSGVHPLDDGEIELEGKKVSLRSAADARGLGIETVFQDLAVFDNLDVGANFAIGREVTTPRWLGPLGIVSRRSLAKQWTEAAERLGIKVLNARQEVGVMSGGQRQIISVARAVSFAKTVLILDEPTAALGVRESGQVLELIKRLPGLGLSVILVSHNMDHVVQVADRAMVLRQGRNAGEAPARKQNASELVHLIMGADSSSLAAEASTI